MEAIDDPTEWQLFAKRFERIEANVERIVQGKRREIRLALVGLMAEGHLLIEDVPGVGKTTLAKALARSIDCTFRRIQFTPDLLPVRRHRRHRLEPGAAATSSSGPARSSPTSCSPTRSTGRRPKTQSALLEAWRSARSRSTARPTRWARRSWSSRRRTRSSTRAPTRCPRRSSTGS